MQGSTASSSCRTMQGSTASSIPVTLTSAVSSAGVLSHIRSTEHGLRNHAIVVIRHIPNAVNLAHLDELQLQSPFLISLLRKTPAWYQRI